MSTLRTNVPAFAKTREQARLEADASKDAREAALPHLVGDAIGSEWLPAFAYRQLMGIPYDDDPAYRLDREEFDRLTDGIPSSMWPMFDDVVSRDHADYVRQQAEQLAESRQRLEYLGWVGTSARILANVTDPVFVTASIGAGLATGGYGTAALWGARATRLARMAKVGLVEAAVEGSLEAYLTTQDPERTATDVIWSAAAAGVLSGGITGLIDARLAKQYQRIQKAAEAGDVMKAGARLTEDGKVHFKDVLEPAERAKTIRSLLDQFDDLVKDDIDALTDGELFELMDARHFGRPDLGGVRVDQTPPIGRKPLPEGKTADDFDLSNAHTPDQAKGVIAKLRFSMSGQLMRSPNESVRRLGSMLAEDAHGGLDGVPANFSASEWVSLQHKRTMASFYRDTLPHLQKWMDDTGSGVVQRSIGVKSRNEFFDEVSRTVRAGVGSHAHPGVNAAADVMRRQHRELLDLAKRHKVPGFRDLDEVDTYLMRVHSQRKIDSVLERLETRFPGKSVAIVEQMLKRAIMSGSADITDDFAEKIAKGYFRTVRDLDKLNDVQKARMFDPDQAEGIRDILRADGGLSKDEIENAVAALTKDADAVLHPRAKRRLVLDETFRMDVTDDAGKVIDEIGVEDLLETNAEALMDTYSRQILGVSAMEEVYGAMRRGADDELSTWASLMRRLASDGMSEDEKLMLEAFQRSVVGTRMDPKMSKRWANGLRHVRAFQYVRVMNQVGFAQIAEFGIVLSEVGFKAMMETMPMLPRMIRRAKDGHMTTELLRENEAMWGVGTDWLRQHPAGRMDSRAAQEAFEFQRADTLLGQGMRVTNAASGMAPVNTILQRWAQAAAAQKWANMAKGGRKLSEKRLLSLGLDRRMGARVMDQIKDHGAWEPGMLGTRVRALNIEQWGDEGAKASYKRAMSKWSRRAVQENDIGQMSLWMTSETGSTIIQFRRFLVGAWEKQLLFNAKVHDFQAFAGWGLSMMFGGMAYITQQYANSIGREDRLEYLEERLSADAIGRAAVQRAGFMSFIPSVVDSVYGAAGEAKPFGYGRTTQLSNDLLFGNPTTDFINRGLSAAAGAVRAPLDGDYDFSRKNFRDLSALGPFQNMLMIKNVLEAIGARLPETSQ